VLKKGSLHSAWFNISSMLKVPLTTHEMDALSSKHVGFAKKNGVVLQRLKAADEVDLLFCLTI